MIEINKNNLFSCRKSDLVTIGVGNFFLFQSDPDEFIKTVINMETEPYAMNKEMARGVMFEDLLYYCIENKLENISISELISISDLIAANMKYPEEYKTYFKQFVLLHSNNINTFIVKQLALNIIKPKMVSHIFTTGYVDIKVRGLPDFVLLDKMGTSFDRIIELKTSARTDINEETLNKDIRNCEDYTAFYSKCSNFNFGMVGVFTNTIDTSNNLIKDTTKPKLIIKDISSKIPTIFDKMNSMCLEIIDLVK